jgi:hypothetical protein
VVNIPAEKTIKSEMFFSIETPCQPICSDELDGKVLRFFKNFRDEAARNRVRALLPIQDRFAAGAPAKVDLRESSYLRGCRCCRHTAFQYETPQSLHPRASRSVSYFFRLVVSAGRAPRLGG